MNIKNTNLEKGFYYHYKHDPNGEVNNYAYEVLNVAYHTEIENLEESKMVVYCPLYKDAHAYKGGKYWDVRPYKMFMENVTKNGKTFPRFSRITDSKIIEQLMKIKEEMYGE